MNVLAASGSKDSNSRPGLGTAFEDGGYVPAAHTAAGDKETFLIDSKMFGDIFPDFEGTFSQAFNIVNILAFVHWALAAGDIRHADNNETTACGEFFERPGRRLAAHSVIEENHRPIVTVIIVGGNIHQEVVDADDFSVDIDTCLLALCKAGAVCIRWFFGCGERPCNKKEKEVSKYPRN